MKMRRAVFAIPGDIETKTGGYIYERSLLLALRAVGRDVAHLVLPASFPDPSPAEMAGAVAAMAEVPADVPLIIDGLVFGAVDTVGLARVRAPSVAMVHHPLALETGLSRARAAELATREADNLALAAHVVVPSPHTAAILMAQYGVARDRLSIALPGFGIPDPVRIPSDPPLILSVGILAPRKGHDILLAALARITDLDWQAVIVGAPHFPETAVALKAQCAALGLEPRVRFTGLIAEDALADRYRRATLFALATRYEGYGIVFGEAQLHGLPIVTCSTGAVPDTVPAAAGLLVPPEDAGAFADALRQILTDVDIRRRMAEASTNAGLSLPRWADTAAVMGAALDRLAR
jgi:glycosyltransferase involved in cell wall biosynthesis